MRLKVGDKIVVIAGSDKGHVGVIKEINFKNNTLVVEGAGMKTYTTKPTQDQPQGNLERVEGPIHASNVMYYTEEGKEKRVQVQRIRLSTEKDPKTGRPKKIRKLAKSGVEI